MATCGKIGIPKFCGNSENSAECFINAKRLLGKESEKMAYSALEVAKYVINHEHSKDRPITNLRLQKLLYFVQAKILVETGEPCFEDEMQAWDFGPVVPPVYHNYKFFGAWNLMNENAPKISEETRINDMLEKCAAFSTSQLVEITHTQKPWKDAYEKGRGTVISNESIKEFFLNGH